MTNRYHILETMKLGRLLDEYTTALIKASLLAEKQNGNGLLYYAALMEVAAIKAELDKRLEEVDENN